jgi:hypothetical protein
MTDQTKLERRYRRLLAWYPQAFRQDHGEELLAVVMACAPDGQHRPGLSASADLIRSGLRMRLRPRVPRSPRTVRAAVRLMYAGAAVTALSLIIAIISVAFMPSGFGSLHLLGRTQPLPIDITVGIVGGLVLTALWLWMARANGEGRHWARILSTVLFGLATLHLFGQNGVAPVGFALVTWVLGLGAVWLLWRPASNAYFQSHGFMQAAHGADPSPPSD